MNKKTLDFIEKSKLKFGDKFDYTKTIYIGFHDEIIYECKKHGLQHQKSGDHLRSKFGCPECAKENKDKGSFIVSKDSKPINKVYVGTQNTLCHKDFVKDIDFLDDINWVACQEFDDLAVGYLMEATSEQKEELKKLVIDWLNNNLEQPNFFEVENIREISKEEFFEKHYIAK